MSWRIWEVGSFAGAPIADSGGSLDSSIGWHRVDIEAAAKERASSQPIESAGEIIARMMLLPVPLIYSRDAAPF